MPRLIGIRACVFDAYGTLFDFASAAARCPDIPEPHRAALTSLWRDKQLQYSWLRSLQGRYADFWQVTGDALDFALDSLGLHTAGRHQQLMELYLTLSPFPEVPAVLATLRQAGFATAILSNGSPAMLQAVVAGAGLTFQDRSARLPICPGPARRARLRRVVPIVQWVGRPCRVRLRPARGLVQPLRPTPRTSARRPGS
jgi:HAD superfamily hydrolase (TIGR01493 family)